MPSNVEIKARIEDLEVFERRAAALADGPAVTIDQHDTFFASPRGRLKLREFADGRGELIDYERPDAATPATSDYRIARTADAAALKEVLADALMDSLGVEPHRLVDVAYIDPLQTGTCTKTEFRGHLPDSICDHSIGKDVP